MSDDIATIPDPKNVPEPGKMPARFGKIINHASNEELCKKARAWCATQIEAFSQQQQRIDFCNAGGVMDVADRMARVALRRDTSSAQYQATLSDVACTAFLKGIRAMTAGETSVYFQSDELPAEYEALGQGVEVRENESRAVAEQRQVVAEYCWNRDNRRARVRKGAYFLNKYGQQMWSMEWDYRTEKKIVRTQSADGGFRFEEVEMTIADNPTLIKHDLKNMYFDAQLDDMQDQQCIGEEGEVPYRLLLGQQATGQIMNVEQLNPASFAVQDYNDEAIQARMANAGTATSQTKTGLIKRWNVWAWLPVAEDGDKAEWDDKAVPKLFWLTFTGPINGGGPCLRFIANPYFHGRNPYFLEHAYSADDKGAYHLSPAETVMSLYWQAVTNWNQAHDNVTLRNRAPYIADGPVLTRNLTFKANQLIRVDRGVTLKPIEVPRTTEITMEMAKELETDIYSTLGTDKPILGIPFLGRTSASEATTAYEQARVPLLQKADDNANDLFGWMFEMDALLMEQYGDPELILGLTKMDGMLPEFKPSKLFGPFKVKVTAITRYETRMQRRRALNAFLTSGYQLAAPIMGKQGEQAWWRSEWPEFGFKAKADMVFPPSGDYDAVRVAVNESHKMLRLHQYDEVEPEDNHRAHLSVHEAAKSEYKYQPDADKNADDERRHDGHIQKHKNYIMQVGSPMQPKQIAAGNPMEEGAGVMAGLPGEAAANPMEAEAGAEANL